MSADSITAVLANGSDDCRSAQPPTENAAQPPSKDAAQPPTKDAARFAAPEIKQEFDVASLGALVKNEHPGLVPWVNECDIGNYALSLEPRKRKATSRGSRKRRADSTTEPQGDYYGCPPEFYDSNIQKTLSKEELKKEIKEEILDLGCEPYYYDETPFDLKPNTPKVGFDRGLEPDHIVGATEINGKLMFLIAWKNSIDGEADLLEAKEVYEKSPQVAIRFYEDRLVYIPKKDLEAPKKRKR